MIPDSLPGEGNCPLPHARSPRPAALDDEEVESGGPAVPAGQLLRPLPVEEFLALRLPPREMLLGPILPCQGLALLYGPRGCGKTHLALGIALAVASGGRFLRWQAPQPRRVIYVDGEMPAAALQERLREALARVENPRVAKCGLAILAADTLTDGLPDLGTEQGRKALASALRGFDLIVVDNLSALTRSGRENESEDWAGLQSWALAQRRAGQALLLVHHAGKSGDQRGTSRREDVLDTSIRLSRPEGYRATEGARFRVDFTKARGFHGPDAEPFEAWLRNGAWEVRESAAVRDEGEATAARDGRITQLAADGLSQREIARNVGCGLATVNRVLRRLSDG